MKKFLHFGFSALVLGLFFTSCNNDDDYNTIESVDKIKIDSVRIVNDTMDVFRFRVLRLILLILLIVRVFMGMIMCIMII
jgi:hypothetical protein